jgi:putative oxidoreductase
VVKRLFKTLEKITEAEMDIVVLLGRLFYSCLFITSGLGHLTAQKKMMAGMLKAKNLPAPELLVIASGLVELIGGVLIVLGFHAQCGAWLIVLFLVPVTFTIHNFWTVKEPQARMMQMVNFNKNIALVGAALLIAYFGSGPLSLGD